jgi:hypothetical protein
MTNEIREWAIEQERERWRGDLAPLLARVPEHLREGIERYVLDGGYVGDFLSRVIENDLLGAVAHGDDNSLAGLKPLMQALYNGAPTQCRGSIARRQAWQEQGGIAGMVRA